ncbi:MAG: hypothetical protein M3Q85_09900, partial [Acidobacteriota bacterium]|nr:hypothetical protein [Acidobacteriota bacterium]
MRPPKVVEVIYLNKLLPATLLAFSLTGLTAPDVAAQPAAPPAGTFLCDVAYEDCRAKVLTLIRNEDEGIDLSFWFMT